MSQSVRQAFRRLIAKRILFRLSSSGGIVMATALNELRPLNNIRQCDVFWSQHIVIRPRAEDAGHSTNKYY